MKLVKKLGTIGTMSTITLAMFTSQLAMAQDDWTNTEWANSAWYIGGGVGRTKANVNHQNMMNNLMATGATNVMFTTQEKDTAYKLFVGKQLNQNFAIEASVFNLGRFNYNATAIPSGVLNEAVRYKGASLDLLGQLPLSEQFSVYARFGVNYTNAEAHFSGNRLQAVNNTNPSTSKFNPKIGLGMEYKLTQALAIRGEVERLRVNDAIKNRGDIDFYSISLVYKLGQPAPEMTRYVPTPMPISETREVVEEAKVVTPPKPVAVSEKATFAAEALFDFDNANLKPNGKADLDNLLKQLKGMDVEVMVPVGHTDSIGSEAYNQKLSMRRAEAVKEYLVSKGVDASRVFTEGKGELQAIANNKTSEGRAKNRRVTIEVVGTRTVMK